MKSCPQENKMIYFKRIESKCLLKESSLKLLLYSDMIGFNNDEKLILNLKEPSPSNLECIIPKTGEKDYIECSLDISKFPLVNQDQIKMPDTFPTISDCYISNWININKEINTGKCHINYSLVFSPDKSYETKCYEKNYNVIALIGSLSVNGKDTSDITRIYSFTLNSFGDGNYDNIKCEIYPPDPSFSQYRMFCYTNKISSITIYQTMVIDTYTNKNIFINTTNYYFKLLDCSSTKKLIYLKGLNLKYSESFININFYGKFSGTSKTSSFTIKLYEPNYSYISCVFPSLYNNLEDAIIECKYDLKIFPLIKTDKIKMPNIFPKVQDYTLSNWDFINKELYIGYKYPKYSFRFTANDYINANCYVKGFNVFSAKGSIVSNDNYYNNITTKRLFFFKDYNIIIKDIYNEIFCRLFHILNNEYQMDCYTTGNSMAEIFPTIVTEDSTNELIFIDFSEYFFLRSCYQEIKKTIEFQGFNQPKCIENGNSLMLTFTAYKTGFVDDENIKLNIYTTNTGNDTNIEANCIIPFQRNGEKIIEINCILDTQKYPLKNNNIIHLPSSFTNIEKCVITNWYNIYETSYEVQCYKPHEIIFSDLKRIEQNCKSQNEAIVSIIGYRKNSTNGMKILSNDNINFSLSVIIDNNITDVECEMYSPYRNSELSQMDCHIKAGINLRLFETIIQDKIDKKYIFIDKSDKNIFINDCNAYNKFINFDGKMEIKPNLESSQLQLFLFSQTINFEKEETLRFNLEYPKFSYMDCLIPASNSNNNEYIKCSLDINKFPLTKEDNIVLPSELKVENYSFTKYNKITKELTNISCVSNYSNIFYSLEEQNSTVQCDDKGNNIITIYGVIDSNQTNTKYNFNILGMVDSQYKSINCDLDIKQKGNNQIICMTNGKISSQIFQTMGLDTQNKNNILLKVKNYLNYNLNDCKIPSTPSSSKSSTLTIVLVVCSIVIFLVIGFVLFTVIRKKRRESKKDDKINTLKNEVDELQEK